MTAQRHIEVLEERINNLKAQRNENYGKMVAIKCFSKQASKADRENMMAQYKDIEKAYNEAMDKIRHFQFRIQAVAIEAGI